MWSKDLKLIVQLLLHNIFSMAINREFQDECYLSVSKLNKKRDALCTLYLWAICAELTILVLKLFNLAQDGWIISSA